MLPVGYNRREGHSDSLLTQTPRPIPDTNIQYTIPNMGNNMGGFPSVAKGNKRGEKAIAPRPGIPLDKSQMLELIVKTHGNLGRVADALGATRYAVRKRCDNDEELKQALTDARERIIDELEKSCWDDAIETRDTALRCFLLKTQAKHRGYDQSEAQNTAKDIATAAFDFIVNKSKNPAEA